MAIEFTGERVIPGQVDTDLWNEHFARYAFSARLARGKVQLTSGAALPPHTPAVQTSEPVQADPSSQAVPFDAGLPAHACATQVSPVVHGLPSSQEPPGSDPGLPGSIVVAVTWYNPLPAALCTSTYQVPAAGFEN